RQADQSNYDKEVIEVTERFNIFNNIVYGYYTKIIPVKNDLAQTWRSWIYTSEESPVEIDTTAYAFITNYFNGLKSGLQTGNWDKAEQGLNDISEFQHEWGKNVIPADSKVNLEVIYNKLNVFFWLMIVYSFLGILMVLLGFAE